MTDTQLYLPIGIPVVVTVLGFAWSSTALRSEMSARFDTVHTRLDALSSRIDRLDRHIDGLVRHIDRLERRIAVIERDLRTFSA